MIQTKTLNCPSCGAELLDPIYDLEMVDGGRRRLTCGECGRPFTVTASLVYDVTADGEPAGTPCSPLSTWPTEASCASEAAGGWSIGTAPRPV